MSHSGRLHEIDDCLVRQACQEAGREVRGACARLTRGPTARETIREGRFEQDGHLSQDGQEDPSERVYECHFLCLSFGRGLKGPRTGSRQRQHNTAMRISVIVDATMTTEQNHRLTQKRLVIRMKSPPVATSPTSTSSFPWKLPPCILCTHTSCMRHILGCGCTRHTHRMRRPRRTW